jgi:hypothetical protein
MGPLTQSQMIAATHRESQTKPQARVTSVNAAWLGRVDLDVEPTSYVPTRYGRISKLFLCMFRSLPNVTCCIDRGWESSLGMGIVDIHIRGQFVRGDRILPAMGARHLFISVTLTQPGQNFSKGCAEDVVSETSASFCWKIPHVLRPMATCKAGSQRLPP